MSSPTTQVIGYYNQFSYPFELRLSKLQRSILLQPGQFITVQVRAADGTVYDIKCNDPLFDGYVGPNKLACEMAREPQKIVFYPLPNVDQSQRTFEFAATTKIDLDKNGRVKDPHAVAAKNNAPSGDPASPVSYMSIEEAQARGLLKKSPSSGRLPEIKPGGAKFVVPAPAPTSIAPAPTAAASGGAELRGALEDLVPAEFIEDDGSSPVVDLASIVKSAAQSQLKELVPAQLPEPNVGETTEQPAAGQPIVEQVPVGEKQPRRKRREQAAEDTSTAPISP